MRKVTITVNAITPIGGKKWSASRYDRGGTSKVRNENVSLPQIADDLLATSQEWARHLIALRVPNGRRFALRAFEAWRSCTGVAGASLHLVHGTTTSTGLCKFYQGATTHVALHDSLIHLIAASVDLGG